MTDWGVDQSHLPLTATLLSAATIILAAIIIYWILSGPVSGLVNKKISRSKTLLDDYLLPPSTIHVICIVTVTILCANFLPPVFRYYPSVSVYTDKGCSIINIAGVSWVITSVAKGACDYLSHTETNRGGSLVLRNLVTTIVWSIAALLSISILLNRDLAYVISGLGAMAAVLLLVFKDSILGMTAGIRLTINKMLKVNDWVSVPKYGAEGRVEDLTLTAIKIRNWDQSVSSVPPHALISDGFTNHEAMLEKGVRQIRRTFNVDVNSIRRLSPEEMNQFAGEPWTKNINLLKPQVNLTLFRKWLRQEIADLPDLSPEPRFFVKEHPHTSSGIPIEIHLFVKCVNWVRFEELQADFLDNIIAAVHHFGLRLYQAPAGHDILSLKNDTRS